MKLLDHVQADASLSPCGTYRYVLTRETFPRRTGNVLWVMLNPSTADAHDDDPTLRRCQSFTKSWGYDGLVVVNLFALRSTDPRKLRDHPDPVGDANDWVIESLLGAVGVDLVVAAWGVGGKRRHRAAAVIAMAAAANRALYVLGVTKDGSPRHPLYVPNEAVPILWRAAPVEPLP